jgi:VanZ family protein
MHFQLQGFAKAVAWLLFVVIIVLTFVPPMLRPVSGLPHAIEHLAIFFILSGAFALGYPGHVYALIVSAIVFAAVLEFLQVFTPGRHARLSDFLVDVVACCAGIAAMHLIVRAGRSSPT